MSLDIGLVGLPNVGKSTLFNALTQNEVDAENYPFCTVEPNVGVVEVPDERLGKLAQWVDSDEITPASVRFVDIAGLVENAHEGEGLGNQFLSQVREVDALCHVLRVFEDENVSHVEGTVDPRRDVEIIETEFFMSDLERVDGRLDNLETPARLEEDDAADEQQYLRGLRSELASGTVPTASDRSEREQRWVQQLNLLSTKPVLYVFNTDEETVARELRELDSTRAIIERCEERIDREWMQVRAELEAEIAHMDPEERDLFMEEYGQEQSGLERLIQQAHQLLDRITFFTYNENELRAWSLARGSTAPQAAGKVHSDFREEFIRAETIGFETLQEHQSWSRAREAGDVRTEGKDYVVQDGDVLQFRTSA